MTRQDKPRCGAVMLNGQICGRLARHSKGHQSEASIMHTRELHRQWKTDNPQRWRELQRRANKAWYRRKMDGLIQRLGGKCVECGAAEQIEFDHINWRGKVEDITDLVATGAPVEILEAELAKCQLLCKRCHLEKSNRDRAEQRAEKRAA